jgi:predicted Zn-dependent protease
MAPPSPRLGALAILALLTTGCETGRPLYEAGLRDEDFGSTAAATSAPVAAARPAPSPKEIDDFISLENIRPEERPPIESDEGGLWMLVDRAEASVRREVNRVHDAELNRYVHGNVCKLAGAYCSSIRTYILRVPLFNASMSANGMMNVFTGLLLRASNEAEMNAVLGHEIGHFLRRHGVQRQRMIVQTNATLTWLSLAVALVGGNPNIVNLSSIIARANYMAYERDHEREADGYGLRMLYDKGYDPRAAGRIWGRLIREEEKAGIKQTFNPMLASHPAPAERMGVMGEIGEALVPRMSAIELGRRTYLNFILPRRHMWIEDEIRAKDLKEAEALIDLLIEDGVNLGELYYYKGEAYRKQGSKEKLEKALEFYDQAIGRNGTPDRLYKAKGLVLARLERNADAIAALEKYLTLAPNDPDSGLLKAQLETLRKAEAKS